MFCKNCGHQIDDSAYACPYCGTLTGAEKKYNTDERRYNYNAPVSAPNNTLAIVGFILAFIIPIAGLICCMMAKKKENEMDSTGRSLATAGFVISIIECVLIILVVIFSVVIITAALSYGGYYY